MIWKELQQRMRERRAWLLPTLYLLILSAVVVMAYYGTAVEEGRFGRDLRGAEIGVAIFFTTAFTQLGLLLLIAPALSAGSITLEKEQRTLSGLLTSLLALIEIWWGKFIASLLLMVLLLIVSVPVLSLGLAMGGFGVREMTMATATTLIVIASINGIGLYCSCLFRRSVHAIPVCYAIVIALSVISLVAAVITRSVYPELREFTYFKRCMYPNPFFFLTLAFAPQSELWPDWFISAGIFLFIAVAMTALALLHLRRAGEQV